MIRNRHLKRDHRQSRRNLLHISQRLPQFCHNSTTVENAYEVCKKDIGFSQTAQLGGTHQIHCCKSSILKENPNVRLHNNNASRPLHWPYHKNRCKRIRRNRRLERRTHHTQIPVQIDSSRTCRHRPVVRRHRHNRDTRNTLSFQVSSRDVKGHDRSLGCGLFYCEDRKEGRLDAQLLPKTANDQSRGIRLHDPCTSLLNR